MMKDRLKRETHVLLIRPPEDNMGTCALCKKWEELRPYGPSGESVCFDCAMKDEGAAKAQFAEAARAQP